MAGVGALSDMGRRWKVSIVKFRRAERDRNLGCLPSVDVLIYPSVNDNRQTSYSAHSIHYLMVQQSDR